MEQTRKKTRTFLDATMPGADTLFDNLITVPMRDEIALVLEVSPAQVAAIGKQINQLDSRNSNIRSETLKDWQSKLMARMSHCALW